MSIVKENEGFQLKWNSATTVLVYFRVIHWCVCVCVWVGLKVIQYQKAIRAQIKKTVDDPVLKWN
jgi:hypothetical protein